MTSRNTHAHPPAATRTRGDVPWAHLGVLGVAMRWGRRVLMAFFGFVVFMMAIPPLPNSEPPYAPVNRLRGAVLLAVYLTLFLLASGWLRTREGRRRALWIVGVLYALQLLWWWGDVHVTGVM